MSGIVEAGCDEAGRGPLAGSVFAAAVILPPDFTNEVLNDSKQLTERQRYALREVIEHEAVAWAVAEVTAEEIDRINILQASITGMHRALAALKDKQGNPIVPEHIYMLRLHEQYPMYGWDENKGYPTAAHYEAIQKYGVTPYHRKSFNLKLKMQN